VTHQGVLLNLNKTLMSHIDETVCTGVLYWF